MTEGPEWDETLAAVGRPVGKNSTKNKRLSLQEIGEWKNFEQARTGADVAVSLGAVDTGDDFDGYGWLAENAADPIAGYPALRDDIDVVYGDVQEVKFGLITLADLAATRRRVPFWVSPNPFEYAAYPRALFGREDGAKPVYTIPAGTLALTAVLIEEATTNNQVRFIAGGNTPPTHLYCGLWRVDQVTGAMALVYDFGDVRGDVDTGSLTYEVALEMSADMLIDAGEIMMVGILPVGGSFTVGATPRQQIVLTPVLYPQGATELLASQTVLPTSPISDASLNHSASHRIWCSIGQALPDTYTPISAAIEFGAYADTLDWLSPACVNFKNLSAGRWSIADGVVRASGPENFSALDYELGFTVKQKCATDDMFAQFTVGSGWTNIVIRPTRCYVHCANDGSSAVGLFVAQTGSGNATVTIQTVTSLSTRTGTTRATGSDVFTAVVGDVFRIEAVTDPVTDVVTYTGFRNGVPITDCVWVDSGHAASVGVAWRRAGLGASMFTNLNVIYRSAGASSFRYGDLAIDG